jgi:BirA family biotin operon repressor/biotin-[acetyl-CoA-carboxylase] ligase
MYWLKENRRFKTKNDAFEGSIVNVRDNGLLVVNNNGRELEFSLKEIEFLNKNT